MLKSYWDSLRRAAADTRAHMLQGWTRDAYARTLDGKRCRPVRPHPDHSVVAFVDTRPDPHSPAALIARIEELEKTVDELFAQQLALNAGLDTDHSDGRAKSKESQ